jgi:hypothetical protein
VKVFQIVGVIALSAAAVSWAVLRPAASGNVQVRSAEATVNLNGQPLARARIHNGTAVFVNVDDLARAVDGIATTRRLKIIGSSLVAVASGGCKGCNLAVHRHVQISAHVKQFANGPHIPLNDLARALEARVDTAGANSFNLYVGTCTWCVLAPQSK